MDAPHWRTLDALVGACATLHSAMDEIASEAPPTSTEESSSDSDEPPGLGYCGYSSEEDGGDEMDVDEEMGGYSSLSPAIQHTAAPRCVVVVGARRVNT